MNTVVGDNKTIPPASATLWLLSGISCPLGMVGGGSSGTTGGYLNGSYGHR